MDDEESVKDLLCRRTDENLGGRELIEYKCLQWTGEEGTVGILGLNTEAAPESLVGPDKKSLNDFLWDRKGKERRKG